MLKRPFSDCSQVLLVTWLLPPFDSLLCSFAVSRERIHSALHRKHRKEPLCLLDTLGESQANTTASVLLPCNSCKPTCPLWQDKSCLCSLTSHYTVGPPLPPPQSHHNLTVGELSCSLFPENVILLTVTTSLNLSHSLVSNTSDCLFLF